MSEKPILFSGEMVRAILDGRKTMTRRVIKPQPADWIKEWGYTFFTPEGHIAGRGYIEDSGPAEYFLKLRYVPGDLLWVRETFSYITKAKNEAYHKIRPDGCPVEMLYRATAVQEGWDDQITWSPSIHMPKWASRLTLRVTAVRVERVQDISEEDALSEGIDMESDYASLCINIQDALPGYPGASSDLPRGSAALAVFAKLWDSINAKRGYSWESNPWVFVITFSAENIGK